MAASSSLGGKVRRGKQNVLIFCFTTGAIFHWLSLKPRRLGCRLNPVCNRLKEYAEILGLKFAYATNGHRIIEIDYTTGTEREVDRRHTRRTICPPDGGKRIWQVPARAFARTVQLVSGKVPRYYQQIAITA